MRGNPPTNSALCRVPGSIPACAGEPDARVNRLFVGQVYPRVCGGTAHGVCPASASCGLSPRVRGNPADACGILIPSGSIPACAGEPSSPSRGPSQGRVYPRVCGGTVGTATGSMYGYGLSPRVRGNPASDSIAASPHGSIPACAGEPPICHLLVRNHWVYPRVCGGTRLYAAMTSSIAGLSPRVRGNRLAFSAPGGLERSIPACAGEPVLPLVR